MASHPVPDQTKVRASNNKILLLVIPSAAEAGVDELIQKLYDLASGESSSKIEDEKTTNSKALNALKAKGT
ncbi:hypothetical protein NLJ89_g2455 [Agrocybe chaxingu]|uniref:Uncharacterized protein n=1 Tax=Agrocybe chaxingu TaxID=84603 RepID=A0A9W8KC92_9AGAR|nr:hypothetical protein NLJ89_g2455 [Agrocybe chaxingu]